MLGQPGGTIDFTCDITVETAAPSPGQAHLRAVGLMLQVPTDGTTPDFGIAVRGLQLPGATVARDITLSLANLAELDNIVLDLVIGLVEAQARQAGGAVRAFARLIGISAGTPIPTLPLDQLAQELHVHIRTLQAAARTGRLHAHFTVRSAFGRPIRYASRAAGEQFISRQ